MNQSQTAMLKKFNFHSINQCIPLEDILKSFPDGVEDLKALLAAELICPYDEDLFEPQEDILPQVKTGLKLTKKGADLLMRLQFLF